MNPFEIIENFYDKSAPLFEVLICHSECVARKALECARNRKLEVDTDFIYEASMLHDIGIIKCDAPGIFCNGDLPYICHGVEGRKMLDSVNLPRHALVCERHTGAGLTVEDIKRQNLPLPRRDMTPVSLEEKLICYADKFYSKSGDLKKEKPLDKVITSLSRHGQDTLSRFLELHELFGQV